MLIQRWLHDDSLKNRSINMKGKWLALGRQVNTILQIILTCTLPNQLGICMLCNVIICPFHTKWDNFT